MKVTSKRVEVVASRLTVAEAAALDQMRGSISRSQYIAMLIRKAGSLSEQKPCPDPLTHPGGWKDES